VEYEGIKGSMKFFTRREKFFDLFEALADRIEEGGKLFAEIINHYEHSEQKLAKLKEIEHEADTITHDIYHNLHNTFITPLDREDIYSLASKMDTILDLIESAAVRMYLYRIKRPTKELAELARILNKSITEIRKIVYSVRNKQDAKMILGLCVVINTLENEADQVLRTAMMRLFENEKDPIELIKLKEIIQTTETATDVCEDVSNVIEGIILKH
jgi:predicted phosphate transport protein (TIGR00153 family)